MKLLLPLILLSFLAAAPGWAETVRVKSGGVALRAELTKPKGKGPFPAVVLMHGCGGWQPAVLKGLRRHARYLAGKGFAVLNLDSFGARGRTGGVVCQSFASLASARSYRQGDAIAARRYLAGLPFIQKQNIFQMGQSNGGSVSLLLAKRGGHGFRAIAAYYPWCGAFGGSSTRLRTPLIVFGGSRDDWTPPAQCKSQKTSGARYRAIVYPGAAHSFDVPIVPQTYLGKQIGYNGKATGASRARMVQFFRSAMLSQSRTGE